MTLRRDSVSRGEIFIMPGPNSAEAHRHDLYEHRPGVDQR